MLILLSQSNFASPHRAEQLSEVAGGNPLNELPRDKMERDKWRYWTR